MEIVKKTCAGFRETSSLGHNSPLPPLPSKDVKIQMRERGEEESENGKRSFTRKNSLLLSPHTVRLVCTVGSPLFLSLSFPLLFGGWLLPPLSPIPPPPPPAAALPLPGSFIRKGEEIRQAFIVFLHSKVIQIP